MAVDHRGPTSFMDMLHLGLPSQAMQICLQNIKKWKSKKNDSTRQEEGKVKQGQVRSRKNHKIIGNVD